MKIKFNKECESAFLTPVDETMKNFKLALYAISIIYVLFHFFSGMFFGIKAISIFVVSVFVSREIEILFLSHFKKGTREEAIEVLKETYPEVTAILFALILPIGTPLVVVAIGAIFTNIIVKQAFGGFSYNIFNLPIAGFAFTLASFPSMLKHTLNPWIMLNIDTTKSSNFFSKDNFVFVSIVLLIACAFLIFKKVIEITIPVAIVVAHIFMILCISFMGGISFIDAFNFSIKGTTLFAIIFLATDQVTSPRNKKAKIIYGVIATAVAMYIGLKNPSREAMLDGILFANILTPFLNVNTKEKNYIVSSVIFAIILGVISYYLYYNFI